MLPRVLAAASILFPAALYAGLEDDLGRTETRIYSAPFVVRTGMTIGGAELPARLERLGYQRVRGQRPERAGQYFWGHQRFWIYRRGHRLGGRSVPALLFGLELGGEGGEVSGFLRTADNRGRTPRLRPWLEPELLAESLDGSRAERQPISLDRLPEHVWRAVLAAEDARFFEHGGLDSRAIARAALANAKAGRVTQGGSTISQQLVKIRDLRPKRSLGRKLSEAVRALALEAEYDKEEILEAYLNHVYFGHLEGVSLYGIAAASRAYFSRPPERLDLGQAALLAAIIQGPNRLSPVRHPKQAQERWRWVLRRLEELEWAPASAIAAASRSGLPRLQVSPPQPEGPRHLIGWLRSSIGRAAERRLEQGRGFVVETTLDALLQQQAETAVANRLEELRASHRPLRDLPLQAALVVLDGTTGAVRAYVGGDPRDPGDAYDRARLGRRQPGSTVKPLVLLEAFERCGGRQPLFPSRRVSDRRLRIQTPSGPWEPQNADARHRDSVTIRQATVLSLNLPFVRIARWCGFEETAERLRRCGLEVPVQPPPSFALGSLETTVLELAAAYTPFVALGERHAPYAIERLARPSGNQMRAPRTRRRDVSGAAAAYLVRDLLRDVAAHGLVAPGASETYSRGRPLWGKTGTSSERRDAWFVGGGGRLLAVAWVGVDLGGRLGLAGAEAAAPLWLEVMERAQAADPDPWPERPDEVLELWVDEATGRLVPGHRPGAYLELFRRGHVPPRKRWYRTDPPLPIVE